jgi:O-antigen ligase
VNKKPSDKNRTNMMFYLIFGYLFLYVERPWEIWAWLAPFHIERIYMLLAMFFFVFWGEKKIRWGAHPVLILTFLFLHYALSPFAFSMSAALDQGFEYFKMAVFYFLLIWSIQDEIDLRRVIKACIWVMFIYLAHSSWEYHNGRHVWRMEISRMIGVDQFASDPNTFSGSIALSIPFLWFLWKTEEKNSSTWFYLIYAGLALVCVILTGSRSGFIVITLGVILALIWNKGLIKKMIYLLSAVILSIGLWQFIPAEKQNRLKTIWNPESGPANAQESAEGRIEGLRAGLRMFSENPLTGVGAGGNNFMGYREAHLDGIHLQAHNLIGELLGEMGLLGTLLFLGQIIVVWRMSGTIRGPSFFGGGEGFPGSSHLGAACRQTLLLLLVSGFFGHNLYRINWLWVGGWAFLRFYLARENLFPKLEKEEIHSGAFG